MRRPYLEHRPRRDGSTGYRVKWWEADPAATNGERGHSITFDDVNNATRWRDALTEHGTATAAARAMLTGSPASQPPNDDNAKGVRPAP